MNELGSLGRSPQPTEGQVRILLLFAKDLGKTESKDKGQSNCLN